MRTEYRENLEQVVNLMNGHILENFNQLGVEITVNTYSEILDIVDRYNMFIYNKKEQVKIGQKYRLLRVSDDKTILLTQKDMMMIISREDEKYFNGTLGVRQLRISYHAKCKKFVTSRNRLVHLELLGYDINYGNEVHHINTVKSDNSRDNLVELTKEEHVLTHCFIRRGVDPVQAIKLMKSKQGTLDEMVNTYFGKVVVA